MTSFHIREMAPGYLATSIAALETQITTIQLPTPVRPAQIHGPNLTNRHLEPTDEKDVLVTPQSHQVA